MITSVMENQNDGDYRSWADLPKDNLRHIFNLLPLLSYLRATLVCKSWSSIAKSRRRRTPSPCEPPWLMLQEVDHDDITINYCKFFSPLDDKVFKPQGLGLRGKRWRGSSHGWLVTVQEGRFNVSLFNPFSKAEIQLPHQSSCPVPTLLGFPGEIPYRVEHYFRLQKSMGFIRKAILSAAPTDASGCVVAIITFFKNIAFCRVGVDDRWRVIDGSNGNTFIDIVFYMGKLYAVDRLERFWSCDLSSFTGVGGLARLERVDCFGQVRKPHSAAGLLGKKYLVECNGELLLVVRHFAFQLTHLANVTTHFKVYEFDPGLPSLEERTSLGEHMMFLGMNQSVSYSAKEFSGVGRFRSNCIYFTAEFTDYEELEKIDYHDNGFYSMEDGSIEKFLLEDDDDEHVDMPIWVSPIYHGT